MFDWTLQVLDKEHIDQTLSEIVTDPEELVLEAENFKVTFGTRNGDAVVFIQEDDTAILGTLNKDILNFWTNADDD